MGLTLQALEEGLPDVTLITPAGKPGVKLFKPIVPSKRVDAIWLKKDADLPSDLFAVLGNSDPLKKWDKTYNAELCTLLHTQNRDLIKSMTRTDWLGTTAAILVRDLINGPSEGMSGQVTETLKEINLLQVEAAQTRKEVLSSLVISQVNMKLAKREAMLKEVSPAFAKHSLDLLRLPLASDSLFPEGNKVIAGWSEKVQLATLAALANPAKSQTHKSSRRGQRSGGRGKNPRPQVKDDQYYNQQRNDRGSYDRYDKKPSYPKKQSFRDPKKDASSGNKKPNRGRGSGGRDQSKKDRK